MDAALSGPLAGIRVIELAGIGPGPFGGMVLADLGADVVRIDRPADVPPVPSQEPSRELLARGKRSAALDLKEPGDLEAARRLIDRADVLIDPFRPGVLERLGLQPSTCLERNPRLIVARMTGWGQEGPLAGAAGHDVNYIALAGALQPMGDPAFPPQVPLNLIGDFGGGGMLLAFGVAAALFERERSGRGQIIDVAMVDGVATLMTSILQLAATGLWSTERGTNWLDGAAPWYRVYRTADEQFLTIGALEEKFYAELLERLALDPDSWPQWDTSRWPGLHEALEKLFAQRTLADWQAALEGTDVCFAPALRPEEARLHPHIAARGTYVERDGRPPTRARTAVQPHAGRTAQAPALAGEHTEEILAELHAANGAPSDQPR